VTDDLCRRLADEVIAQLATDCGMTFSDFRRALRQVVAQREHERRDDDHSLSTADVARRVNRDTQFVRREIERGHLVAVKLGGRYSIAEPDVEAWLSAATVHPSGPQITGDLATPRRRTKPGTGVLRPLLKQTERQ
jgi:excisionase family DNA binding protein